MLLNAIGMKILSLPPWTLFRGLLAVVAIIGVFASLVPPFVVALLDQTRKAKAIRRGEVTAEAQRQIDRWKLRALDAEEQVRALKRWQENAVRALQEARNHNRNQSADITSLIKTGPA